AQSGEFALVIFTVAFDGALLDERLFQQLLLVVVLSMLATPPLAGLAYRLATSRRGVPAEEAIAEEDVASTSIVIVGFGRVGRRVGEIFEMREVPYVAVDIDASLVKRERIAGRSVFYGDARQPDVLKSLGVHKAGLIIVTVDDFQATEQVVSSLHRELPELNILARGHSLEHCRSLQIRGAWLAVSENLEASIALAHAALVKVKGEDVENDAAIDRFRKDYYSDTE
ncbi:NAD-binding protein, partial [Pseudomonadota bacterium]